MATEISVLARHIPTRATANCYAFALALPHGKGGWAVRPHKAQPGQKCYGGRAPPLPLHEPSSAREELRRRIACDNERTVEPLRAPYTAALLRSGLGPDEREGRAHLMACIFGKDDFHFLRRVYLRTVLNSLDRLQPLTPAQQRQLLDGWRRGRRYCWVHQRGWSAPRSGAHGAPTVLDASGRVCWSPVPREAPAEDGVGPRVPRASFAYPGLTYDRFAGLFRVQSRAATVYHDAGRNRPVDTSGMSAADARALAAERRRLARRRPARA